MESQDPLPDEEAEYIDEVKPCSYFQSLGFCLEFDACLECNPELNKTFEPEEAKIAPTTTFSMAS